MIGWGSTYFPDPVSDEARSIISVYEHTMVIIVIVMTLVIWFLCSSLRGGSSGLFCSKYLECPKLEFFWSIFPITLMLPLFILSCWTLYKSDEPSGSIFSDIKVIGHQWYWEYQYGNMWFDGATKPIESRPLLIDGDLNNKDLYNVDYRMVIPFGKVTRLSGSSADVIHSWSAPALGVKFDCIPGRINRSYMKPDVLGVIYGMCSELCGSNHSLMPICVEIVPPYSYYSYVVQLVE